MLPHGRLRCWWGEASTSVLWMPGDSEDVGYLYHRRHAEPPSADTRLGLLDTAQLLVTGRVGVGWRVKVIGGLPGSPHFDEWGEVLAVDEDALTATVKFERYGLDPRPSRLPTSHRT